jgi:uncharacterized membrane protein
MGDIIIDPSRLKTPKDWLGCGVLFFWLLISFALAEWILPMFIPDWRFYTPDTPQWIRQIELELVVWTVIYNLLLWVGAIITGIIRALGRQGGKRLLWLLIGLLLFWLVLALFLVAWFFPGWPMYTPNPLTGIGFGLWFAGWIVLVMLPIFACGSAMLGNQRASAEGQTAGSEGSKENTG